MTREVTDQLYIELDYFTPEEYFVYIAEAQSAQTSNFTVNCDATRIPASTEAAADLVATASMSIDVSKIVSADAVLNVEFTQTTTLSNIYGADLFAFSNAALAAEVAVIRDYNLTTSSQFDLATDFVRTLVADSFVSAEFAESVSAERSRDYASQIEAAFSFDATAEATKEMAADLASSFALSASAGTTQEVAADLSSEFQLTAEFTRTNRSLEITEYQGGTTYTPITIDASIKKWGSGSIKLGQQTSSQIYPTTKPVYVSGTSWTLFSTAYTWKTTDDGATWTRTANDLSSFATADLTKIIYANSTYITVSGSGKLCYSSDGFTWQETASIGSSTYTTKVVVYSNSLWIVATTVSTGIYIYTSSNLSTWTLRYTNASGSYTATDVRAISTNGTQSIFDYSYTSSGVTYYGTVRSTNGTSWSSVNIFSATPTSTYLTADIENNGSTDWVAIYTNVSTGVDYTKYSTDSGSTWSSATTQSVNLTGTLVYFNSKWYNTSGAGYVSSDLGVNWSSTDNTYIRFNNATSGGSTLAVGAINGEEFYTTADVSTWTKKLITDVEQIPGHIDYSVVNWSALKTIDFWFYATGTNSRSLFAVPNSWSVSWTAGRVQFISVGNTSLTSQTGLADSSWHHIRILTDGSTIKMYVDGSLSTGVSSTTNNGFTASDFDFSLGKSQANNLNANQNVWFDELLITKEQLNTISDTTITVPTGEFTNTTDTSILLHFNGDFLDDAQITARIQEYTAALAASATATADAEKLKGTAIDITATATALADVEKIVEATSDVLSEFTTEALALRIFDFAIDTDAVATELAAVTKVGYAVIDAASEFTQQTLAAKTTETSAAFAGSFTNAIDAVKTASAAADVSTEFTLTLAVETTKEFASDVTASATAAVTADKILNAASDFVAASTATASAARLRDVASDFASAATASTQAEKITDTSSNLSSEFTTEALALRIFDFNIATDAVFSELAAVAKIGDYLVTCETAVTMASAVSVIRSADVTLALETTASALAAATRTYDIDASAVVTQTALADRTRSTSSALTSEFTQTAAGGNYLFAQAQLTASATQTSQAARTRDATANLPAIATELAVTESISSGVITMSSQFAMSASVRSIHIDPDLTYKIPREQRTHKITPESRAYTVIEERREYII